MRQWIVAWIGGKMYRCTDWFNAWIAKLFLLASMNPLLLHFYHIPDIRITGLADNLTVDNLHDNRSKFKYILKHLVTLFYYTSLNTYLSATLCQFCIKAWYFYLFQLLIFTFSGSFEAIGWKWAQMIWRTVFKFNIFEHT